jgi:uncharacterized membrane protein (UPF0127 family)
MRSPFKNRVVRILSLKDQSVIAEKCNVADRFVPRLRGLIGTTRLAPGEGLLLYPCNDIHMWFMSIAIDVVFLRPRASTLRGGVEGESSEWEVVSTREDLRPWKPLPARDGRATATLELPSGSVGRLSILPGDGLCIS